MTPPPPLSPPPALDPRDVGVALPALVADGWGALELRRAWPLDLARPDAGLALELLGTGPAGTREVLGAVLPSGRPLEVLPGDPALPGLARWRTRPGVDLVGHRPGRRAVLRRPDGCFAKLARRSATVRAVRRLAAVEEVLAGSPAAPGRPDVVSAVPDDGELVLAPAPGRPLAELLLQADEPSCRAAGLALGAALAVLARAQARGGGRSAGPAEVPPDGPVGDGGAAGAGGDVLPVHGPADEAAVVHRWGAAATVAGAVRGGSAAALARAVDDSARAVLEMAPAHPVPAHRDLHEGQVLVAGGSGAAPGSTSGVVLLDWDTAALADPAADLANLLAHLDLLAARRPERAQACAALEAGLRRAAADGGHPLLRRSDAEHRLAVLRRATTVRLVCVHAFRVTAPLEVVS